MGIEDQAIAAHRNERDKEAARLKQRADEAFEVYARKIPETVREMFGDAVGGAGPDVSIGRDDSGRLYSVIVIDDLVFETTHDPRVLYLRRPCRYCAMATPVRIFTLANLGAILEQDPDEFMHSGQCPDEWDPELEELTDLHYERRGTKRSVPYTGIKISTSSSSPADQLVEAVRRVVTEVAMPEHEVPPIGGE